MNKKLIIRSLLLLLLITNKGFGAKVFNNINDFQFNPNFSLWLHNLQYRPDLLPTFQQLLINSGGTSYTTLSLTFGAYAEEILVAPLVLAQIVAQIYGQPPALIVPAFIPAFPPHPVVIYPPAPPQSSLNIGAPVFEPNSNSVAVETASYSEGDVDETVHTIQGINLQLPDEQPSVASTIPTDENSPSKLNNENSITSASLFIR